MKTAFVGVDFGTSGCRAIAIDEARHVVADARIELPPPLQPAAGAQTQKAEIWWHGFLELIQKLLVQLQQFRIRSICIDGTSGSLLVCDPNGEPMEAAMMYHDASSQTHAEQLRILAPPDCAVHSPTSSLSKALAYAEKYGPQMKRLRLLHQAEWLSAKLTGQYGIHDENNVLKLGYDPVKRHWPDWIRQRPFDGLVLGEVIPSGQFIAGVSASAAKLTGLPAGTRVIAGTTDSTAATLASGISKTGEACTSLGTTLVTKILSDKAVFDANYGLYSHRLDNLWMVGGASNSGGNVLKNFFTADEMQALTEQVDPSSPTGLEYYPLLTPGERFPVNDPCFEGNMTPRPTQDFRFFQALLEGIAGIEQRAYALMQSLGTPSLSRVVTIGGGAKNSAWQQIREQRLGVPVTISEQPEAAFGTALLALRESEKQ